MPVLLSRLRLQPSTRTARAQASGQDWQYLVRQLDPAVVLCCHHFSPMRGRDRKSAIASVKSVALPQGVKQSQRDVKLRSSISVNALEATHFGEHSKVGFRI
jgi:hypothetical protein